MIRTYTRRSGERFCLYVQGHAGEDAQGNRVCAAVSVLVSMLARYAERSPNCMYVRSQIEHGSCTFSCKGGLGEIFDAVVETLSVLAGENAAHMARVIYLQDGTSSEMGG